MKHIFPLLMVAALIVALAGALGACTVQKDVRGYEAADADSSPSPPELVLGINDTDALTLAPRGYSWSYDNGDGTMAGIEACPAHPLDCLDDLPALSVADCGGEVDILLPREAALTAVRFWDTRAGRDEGRDALDEVSTTADAVCRLEVAAGRVYELQLDFGQQGDGSYAFMVTE